MLRLCLCGKAYRFRTLDRKEPWAQVSGGRKELNHPAYKSIDISQLGTRIASETDWSNGFLFEKLPARYYDRISNGLPRSILIKFEKLESISTDDEILELACEIDDSKRTEVFYDVFSLFRKGDVIEEKKRGDLFTNDARLLESIAESQVEVLRSRRELHRSPEF